MLMAMPVSAVNFSDSAISVGTCGQAGASTLMVVFCATVCPGRITDGMASAAAAAEVVFTRVRRVIVTERNCSRSKPVFSPSAFDIELSSSARYLLFARTHASDALIARSPSNDPAPSALSSTPSHDVRR